MIELDSHFKDMKMDQTKLNDYGFVLKNRLFEMEFDISENQMKLLVSITQEGIVSYSVWDLTTREEYLLIKNERARGAFVGTVRQECEAIIQDIALKCFDSEVFQTKQAKRVINYINETYHVEAEYLWKKSPKNAVFRQSKNKKWFGIIMGIDASKLDVSLEGNIEVLNLKAKPENVSAYVDSGQVFPAYHMNKKYWFSIILDNSLEDEMLFEWIEYSYRLVS
ncbi:MmcQ/YjbR family DNA-binding protein [Vagococcus silagei]|uniref:MmcQ/YjbR family DNA-binding protein n=1 Tax=Vagococcus silagei TaxID=2508885 RepID=A0A4V3TVB8_9ENTE|nr:MmcQ/YjbR family DNA-binding protein [Vagococcus silagei]THB62309.1 hypothetical protein ESZ54_00395 [Vagococcus silagei]